MGLDNYILFPRGGGGLLIFSPNDVKELTSKRTNVLAAAG